MSRTIVVVGASVGGVATARALRSNGFTGRIRLVGDEREVPYDKPPLSKKFLTGDLAESDIALLTEQEATDLGIELVLGVAAAALDTGARVVRLADGRDLSYDGLVIATGARPRPAPWAHGAGVHVVRTLDDARLLGSALRDGGAVVVIGGGFIGTEVAATARSMGCDVTIVDPMPYPLARVGDEALGSWVREQHERHGVRTRFGTGVRAVTEDGHLVELADGSTLRADVVVLGIGALPNTEWVDGSGLTVADGIHCDANCRAVGASDVYAVGDVARWFHPDRRELVRVEHWTNAVEQAQCVAYNITHPTEPREYRPVDYVWSDQYDVKIQVIGRPAAAVRTSTAGELRAARPRAAILSAHDDGTLCGAVIINWPMGSVHARRHLADAASLDEALAALS